jgi:hypothetical protein
MVQQAYSAAEKAAAAAAAATVTWRPYLSSVHASAQPLNRCVMMPMLPFAGSQVQCVDA